MYWCCLCVGSDTHVHRKGGDREGGREGGRKCVCVTLTTHICPVSLNPRHLSAGGRGLVFGSSSRPRLRLLNKAHRLQKQAKTVAQNVAAQDKREKHDGEGATRGGREEMRLREPDHSY
jgi:hypothetical protein